MRTEDFKKLPPDEQFSIIKDLGLLTHNKPSEETARWMTRLEQRLQEMEEHMEKRFDKQEQKLDKYTLLMRFLPIEKVVYGLIGLIVMGFFTGLSSLVFK